MSGLSTSRPTSIPTGTASMAPRPTRPRCRRISLRPGSGPSRSTTTRRARCSTHLSATREPVARVIRHPLPNQTPMLPRRCTLVLRSPTGSSEATDPDDAWKGMVHDHSLLQPAPSVLRQELAPKRNRIGQVTWVEILMRSRKEASRDRSDRDSIVPAMPNANRLEWIGKARHFAAGRRVNRHRAVSARCGPKRTGARVETGRDGANVDERPDE